MRCRVGTEQKTDDTSLGEAALALGALWSGETAIREGAPRDMTVTVPQPVMRATHRGARLFLAAVSPQKRAIAALEKRLDALEVQVRGPAPRMPTTPVLGAEEGVKIGETFRAGPWHGPTRIGHVCEVTGIGEQDPGMVPCATLSGFGWVPLRELADPEKWERVRAVETPPVRGEVGEWFACVYGRAPGFVGRVCVIDANGDRWLGNANGDRAIGVPLCQLRNPALWAPCSAPERRPVDPGVELDGGFEGATSDLDGPAGDERIGLTPAGEAAAAFAAEVRRLVVARSVVGLELPSPMRDVDASIARLAELAGIAHWAQAVPA
jgi:hypothetical protein